MPNILFADQQLAIELQKNDTGTRIVLIEQPPKDYLYHAGNKDIDYVYFDADDLHLSFNIKLPHAPGDYLVKETWGRDADYNFYIYKTDIGYTDVRWRSPVTMPKEAVRAHIHLDVEVKKVQELGTKELISIGMPCTGKALYDGNIPVGVATYDRKWFINHWNSLHPGSYERNDWIAVEKYTVTWRKK